MSSVPPNIPPGSVPPYDPKTQWRVYREQQRAAWRTQRDAWKAQRHAWKAGYAGAYGPRVPSMVGPLILIAIGVVALLMMTGHISAATFWAWYARWWPLLLIGAWLALLADSGAAQRKLCGHPDHAGHSGIWRCRLAPRGPVLQRVDRR
jgi:hypothetical protein